MNNNEKKDFFYGAGLDENNNQGMMNNQPMMNQQPMMNNQNQQPMYDQNMMGQQPMMNQQPMVNQQPMMGQGQQPMYNQNMMNQQPMMGNQGMMGQQPMMNNQVQQPMMGQGPMGGNYGATVKPKIQLTPKMIGIGAVAVVAVVLFLVLFVFHKTLSCTTEEEMYGMEMVATTKIEFWFGKATSATATIKVDFSEMDEDYEDYKDEIKDSFLSEYEDDDDYVIKEKGDVVTITMKKSKDMDDYLEDEDDSYDDAKDYFEDLDFTCK